jgi:sec-independent protein translocase protein TatA
MGSFSLIHWVAVILVIILLFGRGRISDLMGDFAKGINSFKKGLNDDAPPANTPAAPPPQVGGPVSGQAATPASPVADEQRR